MKRIFCVDTFVLPMNRSKKIAFIFRTIVSNSDKLNFSTHVSFALYDEYNSVNRK